MLVGQIKKFNMDSIYITGSRCAGGVLNSVACNITVQADWWDKKYED